jgi:hypothetical protein
MLRTFGENGGVIENVEYLGAFFFKEYFQNVGCTAFVSISD